MKAKASSLLASAWVGRRVYRCRQINTNMAEAKEVKKTAGTDPLLDKSNRLRFEYFKFEKLGDHIKGTYVGKYQSFNPMYETTQENYILVTEDGAKKLVGGRSRRKEDGVKVIYGMEKIPMGAEIAFIYDRDYDSGKGNPAKIIEIGYLGNKNMDVYNQFKDTFNLSELEEDEDTSKKVEADGAAPAEPELPEM
jgi:hypothetical protein